MQTQTDRDIAAEKRMRAELARTQEKIAERLAQRVPRDEFDEQVDTGMTVRIAEDPDLHRLYTKVEKRDEEAARRHLELANWIAQVAGERPPAERIADVEISNATLRGRVKVMWVAMSIVGTLALGSLGAGFKLLYDAGVEKGATTQRLEDLEREIRGIQSDVRELTRHAASKGGSP